MKTTIITTILIALGLTIKSQNINNFSHIIENEKLGNFTVNVYADKDYNGLIFISSNSNSIPFAFNISVNQNEQKKLKDFIELIDFDFDGEKELAISSYMEGIYLFDSNNFHEKNIFTGKFESEGYEIPENSNYIHLDRGSYELDEKEKQVIIQGSCGARCGIKEVYGLNMDGKLVLLEKVETDYHQ